MLIELIQNFEYHPPHLSPGDPGYFRVYIDLKSEARSGAFTYEIDVPIANGNELFVVRQANRIVLKNRITQQLDEELAEYGVMNKEHLNHLLEPPATAKRLPDNCAFLELLICFDFYAWSKHLTVIPLIQSGRSAYFEFKQEGDDYIFSLKRAFDIDLTGRSIESLSITEKQKLRVKNILICALISLISKRLFVPLSSVRNKYKNLEIKLNRIDYAAVMNMHRQNYPQSESLQAAIQSGELTVNQAIKILNHEIYDCLSHTTHPDKVWFIRLIKNVCLGLQNLDDVCMLYSEIREDSLKEKIDVHKNPKFDFFLLKDKSNSWQQLLHDIREHAFKLLLKLVGISELEAKHMLAPNNPNRSTTHIAISEPEAVEVLLKEYRNNDIFKEHRGNFAFAEKLFDTQTVKNIDRLIEECQYRRSELKRAERINEGL